MKKNLSKIAQFAFFLGLGFFLVWWSLQGITPEARQNIITTFKNGQYSWLGLSVVFAILSNISRALRWQMLLEAAVKRPSLLNTFLAVMVGYLANLAFPRLGEVARCGSLSKYEGIPPLTAFGTVITERVVDVLGLLVMVLLLIVTQFQVIGTYFNEKISQPLLQKAIKLTNNWQSMMLLVIGGLVLLGMVWLASKKMSHSSLYQKIRHFSLSIADGIRSIQKVRSPWQFLAHSVFIWCMYFLMIYVCFFTIELTSHLGLGAALAVLVFGSFGMVATQGGMGAYQLIVAGLLTVYGIQYEWGLGFSWLVWGVQFGMMLIGGFLALLAFPLVNRGRKMNDEGLV